MFDFLSSLSIDDLESWRETFNLLLITSTLAVCIGVHFEKDGNPHDVQEYGWALVRRGIAVEFALAILLWQLDSVIGTQHKADTAVLFDRATKAELELKKLKISRETMLEGHEAEMIGELKQFSGTRFDTGLDFSSGEQADFLKALMPILAEAGWLRSPWNNGATTPLWVLNAGGGKPTRSISGSAPVTSENVEIHLSPESKDRLAPAAKALISALRKVEIAASLADPPGAISVNKDAMHIWIGQKR